jgi:hypothetical protein
LLYLADAVLFDLCLNSVYALAKGGEQFDLVADDFEMFD